MKLIDIYDLNKLELVPITSFIISGLAYINKS